MIADAYGWTLPEIFKLTMYQVFKLTQAIKYRAKAEHKGRISEMALAFRQSKKSLEAYLDSNGDIQTKSVILEESGFEKRSKKK